MRSLNSLFYLGKRNDAVVHEGNVEFLGGLNQQKRFSALGFQTYKQKKRQHDTK